MARLVVFVAIVAALAASPVAALYFHIKEGENKCFIEEIPDETMVQGGCHYSWGFFPLMSYVFSGKYKTQAMDSAGKFLDSAPGTGMHVEVWVWVCFAIMALCCLFHRHNSRCAIRAAMW
jgi:hypothetical protein